MALDPLEQKKTKLNFTERWLSAILYPAPSYTPSGCTRKTSLQGHGIGHPPELLAFASPFQPGLMIPQGLPELFDLPRFELSPSRRRDQLGNDVGSTGRIEPLFACAIGLSGRTATSALRWTLHEYLFEKLLNGP
jgi:hypothetical protein